MEDHKGSLEINNVKDGYGVYVNLNFSSKELIKES